MPEVFRAAGLEVVLMAELYPHGADQLVPDDQWIADVAEHGWGRNISGAEMARRFEVNLHRIVQRSGKPGPFVDVVHKKRVERRWPPPV